jgi:hypothetical protein
MEEVNKEGLYPNPVVTELVPLEKLWAGEDYHQDYYKLNPNQVRGGGPGRCPCAPCTLPCCCCKSCMLSNVDAAIKGSSCPQPGEHW